MGGPVETPISLSAMSAAGQSMSYMVIDDLQTADPLPESRTSSAPSPARGWRRGPPQAHNASESDPSPNFEFVEGSHRRLDIALRATSANPPWLVVLP